MRKSLNTVKLDNDFMQFVYKRCENALVENKEYMKLEQDKGADYNEAQASAEELCYKKGFADAMKIISNM